MFDEGKVAFMKKLMTVLLIVFALLISTTIMNINKADARRFADRGTDFLVMLKPQFEAKPYQLWKGVVKNEKIRREIIKGFEIWLKQNGFIVLGKRDNEVFGKNGNQERFYHLKIAK